MLVAIKDFCFAALQYLFNAFVALLDVLAAASGADVLAADDRLLIAALNFLLDAFIFVVDESILATLAVVQVFVVYLFIGAAVEFFLLACVLVQNKPSFAV